jgi:hypothetical protein
MARPSMAAATRGPSSARSRSLILLALAVLAFAAGAALAFGFTTKTKPLNAAITAEQVAPPARTPVVSTLELTDCEPQELEEASAATPSR